MPVLEIALPKWLGARPDTHLSKTYQSKPLVEFDGDPVYRELAVLGCLNRFGWNGVWVDSFHSRGGSTLLWSKMPPIGRVELPQAQLALFETIRRSNRGKLSGFFDVFAWNQSETVFLECKGPKEAANRNESSWIEAALRSGLGPESLCVVKVRIDR